MSCALKRPNRTQRRALLRHIEALATGGVKEEILDWAEKHVMFPHSDRSPVFRRELAPWLNEPLRAFGSGKWRVVSMMGPVGFGKSTMIEVAASYIVGVDSGGTLIVGQSDDDVRAWADSRFMPMLRAMPATSVLMPRKRSEVRAASILFPHMPLYIGGANLNTLQSKSMRYVLLDEVWLFKAGMVREAFGRTHDRGNSVIFAVGQAGIIEDEHDTLHETTLKHEYGWTCPECDAWNAYDDEHLKYDLGARSEENQWNWTQLYNSARMRCPKCETEFSDTQDNRRKLSASGSYRPVESNPEPDRIGFHCHALAVWWVPWGKLLVERMRAVEANQAGNSVPLRIYEQKRRAKPWSDDDESPAIVVQASSYSVEQFRNGEKIEGEVLRALTVDKQKDHYWFVVRAHRADGSSMLLNAGTVREWSQIIELQKQYQIPPLCTMIDAGYDTSSVYAFCAKNGYLAMMGDQRKEWVHRQGRQQFRHFYSPMNRVQLSGLRASVVYWSNDRVKDILAKLWAGVLVPFEIPRDVVDVYAAHMTSERKKEVFNRTTGETTRRWEQIKYRANHLWDCECMQVAWSLMMKLLRVEESDSAAVDTPSE